MLTNLGSYICFAAQAFEWQVEVVSFNASTRREASWRLGPAHNVQTSENWIVARDDRCSYP